MTEMLNTLSTPNSVTEPADAPGRENLSLAVISTALLALRERSRALLRERSEELRAIEVRLQEQLANLLAEVERIPTAPPAVTPPVVANPIAEEASRSRISVLEAEVHHLKQLRRDSEAALDEARVMLGEMEDERRIFRKRLDSQEQLQVAEPQQRDDEEVDRLQRRLKLAIQEIRELKNQNAELTTRLEQPAPVSRGAKTAVESFDWETQKQRFLQQLETDFDPSQPDRSAEKLRIQDVLRNTDRVIAEKDRELEELRQLLAEQPGIAAARATDAADREQLLDTSAVILEERQRLSQLQDEWREKLRKSEVEISIERAKLARERLQLEEKLRVAQPATRPGNGPDQKPGDSKPGDSKPGDSKPGDSKPGGAPRGRWLTRLGLGSGE